ncbi:phosphate acyltransferase PlsX [Clostridium algidicarnis]|uniref:phosphate acyltransferase PlsX n=1 Tax=Clostridium algidicarnis TaxID=37659 RepID=UPI00162676CC|nr:phosphate acyltransferase PlsX [Clostridium algidicarnis]MBU3193901.1 phosphate acyltransferase PlsX [Clostridium algidicarnis]MBU3203219.1 phosphate acyltransferase PlsX [Clostridium algidicarnis]MBU3211373.1 phosphate acyltransferase PlsX [Clostridium algidicarnis]MBU3222119.1 phosphate acyltransferase PlsX [Clostridium algidicarnis]
MKIAVDGMGGDNSPRIVVEGSIQALKEFEDLQIIITGKQNEINKELSKYEYDKNKITVVNATEVIDTNDHPVMAIRRKKDSSLVKALNLVKNNEADAIISAGSTGAFMAGSLFIVGRINGIDRPALAPIMPGKNGKFMVVDCGANVDCKPNNLVQFAHMGKIYFENVLGVKNPSIGLVNIGVEEEKGNELTKATYKLLKNEAINFVGNIEPRDVPSGNTDIVVCDGFVGNTILKMYEGVSSSIFDVLKSEIMSSTRTKIGGLLLKPIFKEFKTKFDYKEYGGAAFIGVKGICIKAHGSSDGKALKNAIKQAIIFYDNKIIEKISNEIESL